MTDNQKAEAFALKRIRESRRISSISVSIRMWKALLRLKEKGTIRWIVKGYPIWEFQILKGTTPAPGDGKGGEVK